MLNKAVYEKIPYHTAFVVNPAAGDGKAGLIWSRLEELLNQSGQSYRSYFTRHKGDGSEMAARASLEGAELVVAVGGDGTLREVVNGLDLGHNIFGLIPAGTGNGFARSCLVPLQWQKAFLGLKRWEPRQIDIGRVNGEIFLNIVGIGLDAAVVEAAASKYYRLKGYLAYAFAILDQAASFHRFHCRVECNGLYYEDDQTLIALVANGRYYGWKVCIAPQASLEDGHFDLCLIRKRSVTDLFKVGARIAVGRHLSSTAVIKMQGHKFNLVPSRAMLYHKDGDFGTAASLKVEILPAALRILAPGDRINSL